LGLPGILLLGVGMFLLLRRLRLLRALHGKSSRFSCGVAAFLFMVMGLIEVSGHRLGTVILAAILYGLGQPQVVPRLTMRWLPGVVRAMGALFLLLGGLWVMAISQGQPATSEEVFDYLNQQGRTLQDLEDLDTWVERLPLAARLHHLAGWRAMADGESGVRAASLSFERFQALAPRRWRQLIEHGLAVYPYDLELALAYWEKAISRAGENEVTAFGIIARGMTTNDYPKLRELTNDSADLRFAYFAGLRQDRLLFSREFGLELARNPKLSGFGTEQKRSLLWQYGELQGISVVARILEQNPSLGSDHWMIVALLDAESGDYGKAVELALQRLSEPEMLDLTGGRGMSTIRAHYLMDSIDPLKVIALVQQQKQEGLYHEAMVIIEVAARKGVRHPYLDYQVAWLHFQLGHHEEAWKLLRERIRNSLVW
jgi:tetratricopeptide (TPR) repeat protein